MEPAVVLLSGGLDSSTLLHYVRRRLGRERVYALSFDYGQKHARELQAARWQAAAAGAAEHRVVDAAWFGALIGGASALVGGGAEPPALEALSAAQRRQPPTYVPNRNMVLLAVAAAYAEARGAAEVFYGAQAQDEYGYWDCTVDFVRRMNDLLALNRVRPVALRAPFVGWRKAEVLRLGLELGVDFGQTWTCYRGGERPCGRCPSCVERAGAFRECGARDPLGEAKPRE